MYEIYYYNQGVYYYQSSFATLKAAREHYCEKYKGFIRKGDHICKRYKQTTKTNFKTQIS